MKATRYHAIVRASAAYDLAVTWPFALPWTFTWLYVRLAEVTATLGLPGAMPVLDPLHVLFANLLGSVVVVWSLARLMQPSVRLGRLDALARGLFASWQLYSVTQGGSAIVVGFTVFELTFLVLQAWPVRAEDGA